MSEISAMLGKVVSLEAIDGMKRSFAATGQNRPRSKCRELQFR
jgi:hypothetical protein